MAEKICAGCGWRGLTWREVRSDARRDQKANAALPQMCGHPGSGGPPPVGTVSQVSGSEYSIHTNKKSIYQSRSARARGIRS
jgi:hypothetical protein